MGLNRTIRRKALREQKNKFQKMLSEMDAQMINERLLQQGIGQADLDKAREEGMREGFDKGCRQTALTCYAAAVRVLRRDNGFDRDQLIGFLSEMDMMSMTVLENQEMVRETLDETGIEIRFGEGVERIRPKEQRAVLCRSCIMADPVSTGVWDCDMIDGITAGKTVCEHYREDKKA